MITNYFGSKIVGSPAKETSVANEDVLSGYSRIINLSFVSDTDCVVIFNEGDGVFVRGNQAQIIPVCSSLKITTNGVSFNWSGQEG